jgi:glycosyltransferase involved in cell wall biosynthesis
MRCTASREGEARVRPLRVCLDARLEDGQAGGIQQFIMGLASGLSSLRDGDEEYLFLSFPGRRAWLEPHLSGPARTQDVAATSGDSAPRWQRLARAVVPTAAIDRTFLGRLAPAVVPKSDGTAETAGAEVMHFTLQNGFLTGLPSIYQPYDLLHEHLPQYFTPYQLKWRRTFYGRLSAAARAVVVMSTWVKEDVVARLGVPAEKVLVVPWAPVTEEYPEPREVDLAQARTTLQLPERFALYPAQTFPHKNHLGLVDAVAQLRQSTGLVLPVVCPGKKSEHFGAIQRRIRALGLDHTVVFPGFVTPLQLRALYKLATCLVFPSLFEGGGMPVFEAYAAELPVACSNVTCLPRQAGGAALLFDPRDPASIAVALERLWTDGEVRQELVRRGSARVRLFSWERTARIYRALYRQLAGRSLTPEDRELLAAPPET